MKKILSTIMLTCFIMPSAMANLIANGSFESTTSTGCASNLNNASFNTSMTDVTAFGSASELDIYTGQCFGPEATDGDFKVNLVSLDAFTLTLTEALIAGSTYTLSFDSASLSDFGAQLDSIFVGTSNSATSAGVQVYEAVSTIQDEWEQYTTTFEAASNYSFLSVSGNDGIFSWHSVDNFSLTLDQNGSDPVNAPAGLLLLLPFLAVLYRKKY